MLKNKHLSKVIGEQCFHKFIAILEYKNKFNGIELIKADRFYPSGKTCSYCGEITCNSSIDRDKNVSINLLRYWKSA